MESFFISLNCVAPIFIMLFVGLYSKKRKIVPEEAYSFKIRILQKQNEQHKASKLRLYEKYAAGSITKEAYIQQKAAADVKIAENDGVIQRSHERMKELDSETACSDEKLDAVCEQYADCKALTYELTHAFISAVYIYDLDNIEIVWKF